MRSPIAAGVVSGLVAGLVFGLGMQLMRTPDGMPVMQMVANVVGSDQIAVGWSYHLFNSAVIGAIFGLLLGGVTRTVGEGFLYGGLYGFAWWILGGLILMPLALGMPAFGPVLDAKMRAVALGSLGGHVLYGLILGGLFTAVHVREEEVAEAPSEPLRRREEEEVRR